MTKLKVGIVCPYSFEAPGGVQYHIRDFAQAMMAAGHEVSVLTAGEDDGNLPDFVQSAGGAIAVPYNGSVARLTFGPRAARRARKWLTEGNFDVLHLHEPHVPSLSMLVLWLANGPIVGTFHSAFIRSRALAAVAPMVERSLEKLTARIAVSEDARRTLIEHLGTDAVVIPNGVYVDSMKSEPDPRWVGTAERPTVSFLGRLDEPRKGLPILLRAVPVVLEKFPGARFLIAGRGETGPAEVAELIGAEAAQAVEFLGGISDEEKGALLSSADIYVAPQTCGESFGIVLVEAMSGGASVVASDLGAFARVLGSANAGGEGGSQLAGYLFENGSSADLGRVLVEVLSDPEGRKQTAEFAAGYVRKFDWATVTNQVRTVYDMAIATGGALRAAEDSAAGDAAAPDSGGEQ